MRRGRAAGEARRAARAAPLADNIRPVRAHVGRQHRPLTEAGVARIHCAALEALEVIGLQAPGIGGGGTDRGRAVQGDDGRIRFPRAPAEDMLAVAARATSRFMPAIPGMTCICRAPRCIS
ncbi:MAG: hypothetical protein R3D84_03585 [Paracoccaceae bacterium]